LAGVASNQQHCYHESSGSGGENPSSDRRIPIKIRQSLLPTEPTMAAPNQFRLAVDNEWATSPSPSPTTQQAAISSFFSFDGGHHDDHEQQGSK
ncbi:hypothetical protein ACLOJK_041724, partial [Asimina triloba]